MYKIIPGVMNKNSPRKSVDKDLKLSRDRYQGSLLVKNNKFDRSQEVMMWL